MDASLILASVFEEAFERPATRAAAAQLQYLYEAEHWRAEAILDVLVASSESKSPRPPRAPAKPLPDPARTPRSRPAGEELKGVERLLGFLAALRLARRETNQRLRASLGEQERAAAVDLAGSDPAELRLRLERLLAAGRETRRVVDIQLTLDAFLEIAAKRIEATLLAAGAAPTAASRPRREED